MGLTVTNVGESEKTNRAEVNVAVNPSTLVFKDIGQKRDFVVTVTTYEGGEHTDGSGDRGELNWVSEKHVLRSPMVIVVGQTSASSADRSYSPDVPTSIDSEGEKTTKLDCYLGRKQEIAYVLHAFGCYS
jgi:hypothetical protein